MKDTAFELSLNDEESASEITENMPQKIGFTYNPKTDNTVT